ncbi:MAG: ABC transporter ATP-binding protein [Eubacteriaceae bacterium]|nr:ABC transporter ATP-binding protein [Eubacteriaceae bacterium]
MITAKNITFAYDESPERHVLDGVSFDLKKESITALAGLSGCGKSTLCRVMTGIIPCCIDGELTGELTMAGRDMIGRSPAELGQKIGFVMQDPDMQIVAATVEDELAFGPENICLPPTEIRHRVDEVMELLGLSYMALTSPSKLSGGQKQLVAIGSVLTMDPEMLIMDEPFSHLDEDGKIMMKKTLIKLRSSGKTVLIVDHDYRSLDFADRIMWMEEGKISEHKDR